MARSERQISNEQPPRDDLQCAVAVYGDVAVNLRPDESPNVWHTFKIICHGKCITVKVDDQRVIEANYDQLSGLSHRPLSGYIGLEDSHSREGHFIEYRKVFDQGA